ncbi:MAG TPA: NUDIX hydrolase [Actinomycetota bacterium]|nr:NUDIX hydrolase [Actinomycetota bacterium]
MSQPVRAAGGIVLRGEGPNRSVALVHRPRYDDWSFPKGKLDDGEDEATAALREVEEETGLRCRLGPSVGAVTYRDRRGRAKVVRYFQMDADGGRFAPNLEVDELRWVSTEDATRLLSYAHDRALLQRVIAGLPASAVYVVRHAKAGVRAAWSGPDEERPLTQRGRKQARRLVERFQGLDIQRILSSPFLRCVQTVQPLGEARGLAVEATPELREGSSVDELLGALSRLDERPTVVCGHRAEIETMIDRLERGGATIEGARGIAKGSVWVLDRVGGRVVTAHYLPAPAG